MIGRYMEYNLGLRIGILGGTFDPIHNGHLHLAKEVRKRLSLDKVIFVPTYLPPHKTDIKIAAARHRYNMVKAAIGNNARFKVSGIEVKRKGRSYSVETLKRFRKKYGSGAEIFFITGSDSLRDIDRWKDLKKILGLCKFVVVQRPRFNVRSAPGSFIILYINARNISSSDIRHRIKRSLPIKKLVPGKVSAYIKKFGLYEA